MAERVAAAALMVLSLTLGAGSALAGPGVVGNGGDAVRCNEAANSPFKGLYSLDYLMTYETADSDAKIAPVYSWDDSYRRLSKALAAADPDLSQSFEDFVGGLDNFSDWTQPKIWREAGFGLVQINDQNIIRKLPSNCYTAAADGSIQVIQTVVQTQRPDQIEYDFDPTVYNEFKTYAPIQYSFLLVHEWLWELTGDVQVIRNVDFFLHSQDATTLTPAAFRTAISNIGLPLVPATFKSVCERNAAIRSAITNALNKTCADIAESDVDTTSSLGEINIADVKDTGTINFDDLTGLSRLYHLKIENAGLRYVFSHALDPVENISSLELGRNQIKVVDAALFVNKPNLGYIDLSDNLLTSVPQVIYLATGAGARTQTAIQFKGINLSNNHLTSVPDPTGLAIATSPVEGDNRCQFFEHNPMAGGIIDLSNNQLTAVPMALCTLHCVSALVLKGNPLTPAAKAQLHQQCPIAQLDE